MVAVMEKLHLLKMTSARSLNTHLLIKSMCLFERCIHTTRFNCTYNRILFFYKFETRINKNKDTKIDYLRWRQWLKWEISGRGNHTGHCITSDKKKETETKISDENNSHCLAVWSLQSTAIPSWNGQAMKNCITSTSLQVRNDLHFIAYFRFALVASFVSCPFFFPLHLI